MTKKVGDRRGSPWICFRCRKAFDHARRLVAHLTDIHNEGAAR